MPAKRIKAPSYRRHKASGQAVVTLDGKDFYLGPHGTKASHTEYDRVVAEWLANGRQLPRSGSGPTDVTINELVAAYWQFARGYYVKNGRPTDKQYALKAALRPLRRLYGSPSAREFGPLQLKTVREAMIRVGWCRNNVNKSIGRIKKTFRWGVENDRVPSSVYHALQAVPG